MGIEMILIVVGIKDLNVPAVEGRRQQVHHRRNFGQIQKVDIEKVFCKNKTNSLLIKEF
jgi:hypothetical protein